MTTSTPASRRLWSAGAPTLGTSQLFHFYAAVVLIQGIHVVEHIIQLAQVTLFGVPDDDALGLLGYVFQFNGTEEWLHLVFNAAYVASLFVIVLTFHRMAGDRLLPGWAFTVLSAGVALESWHMVEHLVIIWHVLRNSGCPCPGIGDRALDVTDTVLHFVYNAIAYAATVVPFWLLVRTPESAGPKA